MAVSKEEEELRRKDALVRPFWPLCGKGYAEEIRCLIEAGADVNAQDRDGQTPLHFAASFGHPGIVKTLLAGGADPNIRALRSGQTPLLRVCGFEMRNEFCPWQRIHLPRGVTCWFEVAHLLIRAGADIHICDSICGNTPLHWAAVTKKADVVELLLVSGADVHRRNIKGDTPLFYAVRSREITERLLAAGADINARNAKGQTPLMLLLDPMGRNIDMVHLLLKHGADARVRDTEGKSVLYYANAELAITTTNGVHCTWPRQQPIIDLLHEAGATE